MSPTWQESWIVRAIENLRKSNGAPEERYLLFHEVQTDLDRIDVEPLADPRSGSGRLPLGLACLAAVAALALLAILVWWMRPLARNAFWWRPLLGRGPTLDKRE